LHFYQKPFIKTSADLAGLFILGVVLTLFFFRHVLFDLDKIVLGDAGDGLFNIWTLAWNFHVFDTGMFKNYFDANIFYPVRHSLLFSEHFFGISLVAYPLWKANYNIAEIYNLALIASYSLRFFTASGAAYVLTRQFFPSCIAGLFYGFTSFLVEQIFHLQVVSTQWVPLLLLFLALAFREAEISPRHSKRQHVFLSLYAFFFCLQGLSSTVFLVFQTIFVLGFLSVWVIRFSWNNAKPFLMRYSVWVLVKLIVFLPFIHAYNLVKTEFGFSRSYMDNVHFSAPVSALLGSPSFNAFYGDWLSFLGKSEAYGFIGLVGVVLLVVIILPTYRVVKGWFILREKWQRGIPLILIWFFFVLGDIFGIFAVPGFDNHRLRFHIPIIFLYTGLFFIFRFGWKDALSYCKKLRFVSYREFLTIMLLLGLFISWALSWGPNIFLWAEKGTFGPGPYILLYYLFPPVFWGIRTPARILVFFVFFFAMLSAVSLAKARKSWQIAACLFLFFEYQLSRVPHQTLPKIPSIYSHLDKLPPGPTLILPIDSEFPATTLNRNYMYFMIGSWFPLYNGYSGHFPPSYHKLWNTFHAFPKVMTTKMFRNFPHIQYVLIHARNRNEESKILSFFENQSDFRILLHQNNDFLISRNKVTKRR